MLMRQRIQNFCDCSKFIQSLKDKSKTGASCNSLASLQNCIVKNLPSSHTKKNKLLTLPGKSIPLDPAAGNKLLEVLRLTFV